MPRITNINLMNDLLTLQRQDIAIKRFCNKKTISTTTQLQRHYVWTRLNC